MGRKNIIMEIDDLEYDHDQEYFEEHFKRDNVNKNNLDDTKDSVPSNIEDNIQEQTTVIEKPVKNSRKKNNINQESSS